MGRDEKWKVIRKEFSEVGVQANNSNRLDLGLNFSKDLIGPFQTLADTPYSSSLPLVL